MGPAILPFAEGRLTCGLKRCFLPARCPVRARGPPCGAGAGERQPPRPRWAELRMTPAICSAAWSLPREFLA